jgi:hypothetical protein
MRVTAEQSIKFKRTHLGADDIAASKHYMLDAIDAIENLRPDMTLEPPDFVGACRKASTLFVNGKRFYFPPLTSPGVPRGAVSMMARFGAPSARPKNALAGAPADVIVMLNSIKPEHIEAIEYHDCMDNSVQGGQSALFVTLKEGVGFSYAGGSYVMPDSTAQNIARRIGLVPSAPPPIDRYRLRLLGVFDASNGQPVENATVSDIASGASTLTSATGSVLLAFLSPGLNHVIISSPSFKTDTLTVNISPADTVPLTVVLRHIDP